MLFSFKRVRRDPYRIDKYPAEEPIRLDEARLRAWAMALGQQRETNRPAFRPHLGQLPDVDFSQVVRIERSGLLQRLFRGESQRDQPGAASGASANPEPALGEGGRKPYVWLVEAESDAPGKAKPKLDGTKLNGSRAA